MNELFIDIETYSEVDLPTSGVQRYVKDPSTQIMLVAYAYNDDPVRVIDLMMGDRIPERLFSNASIYVAHNASFEYNNFKKDYNAPLESWRCTMALATASGLPASLDTLGEALNLPEYVAKLKVGKELIRFFCKPKKPTAKNPSTRNFPIDFPDKWRQFKTYAGRDVDAMRWIYRKLTSMGFSLSAKEQKLWEIDVRMNEKGVRINEVLTRKAHETFQNYKEVAERKVKELTKLDNPNSTQQLKRWLMENGVQTVSVDKEHVSQILADPSTPQIVKDVLTIKQSTNKTSVAKYEKALKMVVEGRIYDYLQYYGAGRTGRWAGRGIQIHNLPSRAKVLKSPELIDAFRDALLFQNMEQRAKGEIMGAHQKDIPTVLSELIRTIIEPEEGWIFAVADYSAIEARVLGWLAGEQWRLDVFRTHGKIYEASASAMFDVPLDKISKGNPEYALRAKGKVAELALGYQGSTGALVRMGALDMGLSEDELPGIVARWRTANKNIQSFWYKVEELAVSAIQNPGLDFHYEDKLKFFSLNGNLNIMLPSGRIITYWEARLEPGAYGPKIVMKNVTDKGGKWADSDTYGGKLVENITQAVARDCLAEALINLTDIGYDVRFHVHDEVIVQVKHDKQLTDVIALMCHMPKWASGLPINADGFCSSYYRKD